MGMACLLHCADTVSSSPYKKFVSSIIHPASKYFLVKIKNEPWAENIFLE